jgi:hypothetical protein
MGGALAFFNEAPSGASNVYVVRSFGGEVDPVFELLSANLAGAPGNGASFPFPAISADGRYVAFWRAAWIYR